MFVFLWHVWWFPFCIDCLFWLSSNLVFVLARPSPAGFKSLVPGIFVFVIFSLLVFYLFLLLFLFPLCFLYLGAQNQTPKGNKSDKQQKNTKQTLRKQKNTIFQTLGPASRTRPSPAGFESFLWTLAGFIVWNMCFVFLRFLFIFVFIAFLFCQAVWPADRPGWPGWAGPAGRPWCLEYVVLFPFCCFLFSFFQITTPAEII